RTGSPLWGQNRNVHEPRRPGGGQRAPWRLTGTATESPDRLPSALRVRATRRRSRERAPQQPSERTSRASTCQAVNVDPLAEPRPTPASEAGRVRPPCSLSRVNVHELAITRNFIPCVSSRKRSVAPRSARMSSLAPDLDI